MFKRRYVPAIKFKTITASSKKTSYRSIKFSKLQLTTTRQHQLQEFVLNCSLEKIVKKIKILIFLSPKNHRFLTKNGILSDSAHFY